MGSSGKVNLRIPCLQSHAFSKTFVSLDMISGLQSISSACTAGRGDLSSSTAAEQEAKEKQWRSPFSPGNGGKQHPPTPFCPLPRCASLAGFLWFLISTLLPAHSGDWHLLPTYTSRDCPGTAMGAFSPSLLRSVVLDALGNWSYEWKYWNHYKKLASFLIQFIYNMQAQKEKKIFFFIFQT